MEKWVGFVLIGIAGAVIMTAVYRLRPFRALGQAKPRFVFFPKYQVAFDAPDAIQAALVQLGFEPDATETTIYDRGKIYGDFSLKLAKVRVEIDPAQRTFRL